jgi:hypothetical protein
MSPSSSHSSEKKTALILSCKELKMNFRLDLKDERADDNDDISPSILVFKHCDQEDIECVYHCHSRYFEEEDSDLASSTSSTNSIYSCSSQSCSITINDQRSFLYDVDKNSIMEEKHNYLDMLPGSILGYIGSYLSVNDLTAIAMTNKAMYYDKQQYHFRKSNFHLVREEKLPAESDFKTSIQPYRFLFHTPSDGILQVELSLVKHLVGSSRSHSAGEMVLQRRQIHHSSSQAGTIPLIIDCLSGFKKLRINVLKKCPESYNIITSKSKVIFRIDQSVPGATLHFESKAISRWKPGQLSYLILLCVKRLAAFPPDGRFYPSLDYIMKLVQESFRERIQYALQKQVEKVIGL